MSGYDKEYKDDGQMMIYQDYDTLSDNMKRWCGWSRPTNVVDELRGMTTEEIQIELKNRALPYAVLTEQIRGDFNMSGIIRSANAFNARDFYYTGRRRWDKRGALGSYIYTPPTYLSSNDEVKALKDKYKFIAIDNLPGSIDLADHEWEENTLIVFGEEGNGISEEMRAMCDKMINIPMGGSIRSLNVGVAAGIIMNDISSKLKKKK